MKCTFLSVLLLITIHFTSISGETVRIGIAGLSHSHVIPLLKNMNRENLQIVGIAEGDTALCNRYAERFGIDKSLFFQSLEEMIDKTRPDGVVTFTSIYEHLEVVKTCAPRGIHVMVEKPLAVSVTHAKMMTELAQKHHTLLLTNYETTWYPSNYHRVEMVKKGELGKLRKVIVYDGHKGPEEIGVNKEFLTWLTDPVLNGGGAVTDFGCYGANLITWLLNGKKPVSVYAELKQYKPDIYPRVDDDATIILSYPGMEGIIHASWNWPFNRKDMHIYGSTGYVLADNAHTIRYRLSEKSEEQTMNIPRDKGPFHDPFTFFALAILGETHVGPTDLSSPEVNMTVVEILEAARESNKTGKRIYLN